MVLKVKIRAMFGLLAYKISIFGARLNEFIPRGEFLKSLKLLNSKLAYLEPRELE